MKIQSLIFLVFLLLSSTYLFNFQTSAPTNAQFQSWANTHQKQYQHSFEYFYRSKVFSMNLQQIQRHNERESQGLESYKMGLNQFSDLTDEQFIQIYLDKQEPANPNFQCSSTQASTSNLPASFDWVAKKDGTSAVKDEGQCKAGYAFSTIQSLETSYFLSKGTTKTFSPQQIVDCSVSQGNKGCTSGNALNSLSYVKDKGITSETAYPYTQQAKGCQYTDSMKIWQIRECVKVTSDKELNLKASVVYQPVIASINGSKIKSYSSGIYSSSLLSSCKTDPSHWVSIVGYGADGSKNFWKLKNSWGTKWGESGYMRIIRKGDGQGECGIQHEGYFTR